MAGSYRRSFAGAAIIGVSVWCAAGTVAVVSGDAASARVAAMAPWWVLLVGAGAAAFVPGWRRRPLTAVPALLATVPWWPVPLPAVALLWTGPAAWVPVAAALLAAEGGRILSWATGFVGGGASTPGRATRLAAAVSLGVGLAAAVALDPRVPGGDEPHYLIITQSLLQDGDLRIENNHTDRDYAAYFGGTLQPDYLVRGRDGDVYSIHAPGVSAVVLPAFAVFGFRGAQATLLLIFALTGALVWRAAWQLTGDASAAWFAWAAVAGSTTLVVLSFMVFPDAPGACAVAAGVWLIVAWRDATPRAIVAVSALLSALPWLHTRFSVLAGALGLAIAVLILVDRARPVAARWRRVALFAIVPTVSAAAWLGTFYAIYGTVDPRVPYGPNPEIRPWIWGAVAGLFGDQQFGLFTYAPVLAAAAAGVLMRSSRAWRATSGLCLGILAAYAIVVSMYWMWWAGVPGLPARFLTAAIPLLGVPVAVAWSRSASAGRTALLALLVISLGMTALVVGVDRGAMAWNVRDAQAAWLEWWSPVVNLPRAWPSFFWNGEASFLRHLAASAAIIAGLWWPASALIQRAGDGQVRRVLCAAWVLLGAMALAQAGWWMTARPPLDPARAQLQVLAASGSGRDVWTIGPGFGHWAPDAEPLRIRQDEAPLADQPSPVAMVLRHVPAGTYRLAAPGGVPAGQLTVTIGRSAVPLDRFVIEGVQPQTFDLSLPAGAATLVAEAPSPDVARQWRLSLVPVHPMDGRAGLAVAQARYGETNAFFLDGNVFAEAEGYWVRGGRTAEVVLSQDRIPARPATLRLRNGGAANSVTVQSGAWREVLSLAAWEEREVALPIPDLAGTWPLSITSASGFRPSDTSGQDSRYLGVWVY